MSQYTNLTELGKLSLVELAQALNSYDSELEAALYPLDPDLEDLEDLNIAIELGY